MLSTALFDKPPFKNLITNGLVLASDGQKMSKSKKNFPDPSDIINKFGADSIRLYLISSPAVRGDSIKFSEAGVKDIIKDAFLPWYNASKFLFQNIERWEREQNTRFAYKEITACAENNIMDKWLLSSIQSLLKFVKEEMDKYRLYTVLPKLVKFIDTLCNWYVRLNRKRLRGETGPEDSFTALNTLYNVLFIMLRISAPFIPFLTESLYQRMRKYLGESADKLEYASVHYLLVPEVNLGLIDLKMETLVGVMQKVILLGRTIRDRKNLPLRHPLKELVVIVENCEEIEKAIGQVESYIYEELNIKNLKLTREKSEYGIEMKAKPNFPVLALKAKEKMKSLGGLIEKMSDAQVNELRSSGRFVLDSFVLSLEDVKLLPKINAQFSQYETDFDENVCVLLDVAPDQEMEDEGVLRDIVNRVQRLRKEFKIVPEDDIVVYYEAAPAESRLNELLARKKEFVEGNIKKPFRMFDKSLSLSVRPKDFKVCFFAVYFMYFFKI